MDNKSTGDIMNKENMKCCIIGPLSDVTDKDENKIKRILRLEIIKAIDAGYNSFTVRMLSGTGIIAAEIVLEFKAKRRDIFLCCVQPYPYFGKAQEWKWNVRFKRAVCKADKVITASRYNSKNALSLMNKMTIKSSDCLLILKNKSDVKAFDDISFAKQMGKKIKVINID